MGITVSVFFMFFSTLNAQPNMAEMLQQGVGVPGILRGTIWEEVQQGRKCISGKPLKFTLQVIIK